MSIDYCRECERLTEGQTITCGACGEGICPWCHEPIGGLQEEPDNPEGFFNGKEK